MTDDEAAFEARLAAAERAAAILEARLNARETLGTPAAIALEAALADVLRAFLDR